MKISDRPILFLDIDGVLNSHNFFESQRDPPLSRDPRQNIDPEAVRILNTLVERTRCQVVLSSMWRLDFPLKDVELYLKDRGANFSLIDKTEYLLFIPFKNQFSDFTSPMWEDKERGIEIEYWIRKNVKREEIPQLKIGIIDDIANMHTMSSRLVQTHPRFGIQMKQVKNLTRIMSEPLQDLLNHKNEWFLENFEEVSNG